MRKALLEIQIIPFSDTHCTVKTIHIDSDVRQSFIKYLQPTVLDCSASEAIGNWDAVMAYLYPPVEPKIGDIVEYRDSTGDISKTGELLYTIPDKYSSSNKHLLGVTRGSVSYATFQHIEPKSPTVIHTIKYDTVHIWSIQE